jgi:hypothetical protein
MSSERPPQGFSGTPDLGQSNFVSQMEWHVALSFFLAPLRQQSALAVMP